MRLVNSIGKIVAQLLDDLLNAVVLFSSCVFSNHSLKTVRLLRISIGFTRGEMGVVLTRELPASSCRIACHSGRVGCFDPWWLLAALQEHVMLLDVSCSGDRRPVGKAGAL